MPAAARGSRASLFNGWLYSETPAPKFCGFPKLRGEGRLRPDGEVTAGIVFFFADYGGILTASNVTAAAADAGPRSADCILYPCNRTTESRRGECMELSDYQV